MNWKIRIPQRLPVPERRAISASTLGAVRAFVQSTIIGGRKLVAANVRKSRRRQAKKIVALTRVHEATSQLWLNRDLNQALDNILAGAIELLGADKGNIQVLDAKQRV